MTQKQILEKILEEQENARQQKQQDAIKMMQVLSEFSVQLNKIDVNYLSIKETLENNIKTGKIGLINKVDTIDERVVKLETFNKLTIGKFFTATGLLLFLGSVIWKLFEVLDFKFK